MTFKDMYVEGYPAAHFVVVIHQGLNKLQIILGLLIRKEALNHCDITVLHYVVLVSFLGNF